MVPWHLLLLAYVKVHIKRSTSLFYHPPASIRYCLLFFLILNQIKLKLQLLGFTLNQALISGKGNPARSNGAYQA
jgi:hypothetical protein